jgi:hypothetical protein
MPNFPVSANKCMLRAGGFADKPAKTSSHEPQRPDWSAPPHMHTIDRSDQTVETNALRCTAQHGAAARTVVQVEPGGGKKRLKKTKEKKKMKGISHHKSHAVSSSQFPAASHLLPIQYYAYYIQHDHGCARLLLPWPFLSCRSSILPLSLFVLWHCLHAYEALVQVCESPKDLFSPRPPRPIQFVIMNLPRSSRPSLLSSFTNPGSAATPALLLIKLGIWHLHSIR